LLMDVRYEDVGSYMIGVADMVVEGGGTVGIGTFELRRNCEEIVKKLRILSYRYLLSKF
jgi:hypothetical protein